MSKVLIDRAVLEATLEHAEFVSGAACDADDAIRAVLAAPISTPELPIKAYYHESPNEHGGLNKSVGLEVRKTFIDAPLVLESDALMQIACLEGEIAKRDAELCERTEEVEHALADLNNALAELAAIKAQDPVAIEFRQFMTDVVTGAGLLSCGKQSKGIAAELSANAYKYLLGAPVSEAKAKGVVMPERKTKADYGGYIDEFAGEAAAIYNAALDAVARLNAAPAAPAADAGLVEALEKLARLGNGDRYGNSNGNMIAQAALAAHRAKGVV